MPRYRLGRAPAWLDPNRLANAPTCKWCGRYALPAGFGPCECPEAMAEHRRIMGDDR